MSLVCAKVSTKKKKKNTVRMINFFTLTWGRGENLETSHFDFCPKSVKNLHFPILGKITEIKTGMKIPQRYFLMPNNAKITLF